MKLFGFGKSKLQPPTKTTKKQLIQWANQKIREGFSRQEIANCLLKRPKDLSLDALAAYSDAEREISGVMVKRNIDGKALEASGQIDKAVLLYEANLVDKSESVHPYNRLRIIYTKRQNYTDAIRVCKAFIATHPTMAAQWQVHVQKLEERSQRS